MATHNVKFTVLVQYRTPIDPPLDMAAANESIKEALERVKAGPLVTIDRVTVAKQSSA